MTNTDKCIEIRINGSRITRDSQTAGVQHEGNAAVLRMEFDPGWDGFAKTVTFWNARGEQPVKRILTADLLEDSAVSTRIYRCPIPPEAMTEAGRLTYVIDGAAEGVRRRSEEDRLRVLPAGSAPEAADPADPTPTQAEQLQLQVEGLRTQLQGFGYPPALGKTRRNALNALAEKYAANYKKFYYDFSTTRNSFANNPFHTDGRVRLSCDTLCLLVWAGIDPASFMGKSGSWDGTLVKAFDWGYHFRFPNRKLYGATKSNGALIGFTKPDPDSYVGSYSYNTYYHPESSREDKQVFRGFMSGSDMAQELYLMGCEVPMEDAQVGDMVFFKGARLDDGKTDDSEAGAFRNISHLALVSSTERLAEGMLGFLECTDYYGASTPITHMYPWSSSKTDYARAIHLESRIVMVARHPAAFGIVNPVPRKFEAI